MQRNVITLRVGARRIPSMLCTLNHAKLTMLHPTLKMETSSSFCLSPKPKGWQDHSHTWHRGMQFFFGYSSSHVTGKYSGWKQTPFRTLGWLQGGWSLKWVGKLGLPSVCLSRVFTRGHREGKGAWKWNSQRALGGEMWQTPAEGTKPPKELGKRERQGLDVNCYGKSE